jgi:hypothetical protein
VLANANGLVCAYKIGQIIPNALPPQDYVCP